MSSVRASLVAAAAALALGLACLAYGATSWPLRWLVRGHLGDVAAAALLYALLGLVLRRRLVRAVITGAIAVAVEVAQRRGDPGGATGVLLGAHFDPWDLVAYAAGLAAAAGWERHATARR